ncbi:hypothetical protein [Curtobacterium herbarum]|uniref:LppA-like lipoprotein n=1 Tax=Curtobacterium herbarum TaxID=150122 RepID=A0ABN1ZGW5_9MICO|nr:hypothetical protein [Curtobacterium herbarum]MBM7474952.1 hypothetical protein [Curtobacterium herbarum]MCS6545596.1 hypothetical protein [Curtobacterium herbarum]
MAQTEWRRTATGRAARSAVAVAASALVLTGCALPEQGAGEPRRAQPVVDADAAKQQMIDAVDDVTGRLGDDWKARTGPDYAEACALPDGAPGAQWRYLVGSSRTGTPEEDAQDAIDHWKASGLRIERRNSSDGPAVFAGGGDQIASISLYAYSGNYTVQAVSLCFPGDPDELGGDLG